MNPRKDLSSQLAALQPLEGARGKNYWRSLEELADTAAFQELIQREFPEQASVWPDSLSRRKFLTLMGASLALAGLSGCSVKPAPSTTIVPYVRPPEEIVPGKPLFFATAMTLGGGAVGLLVESHQGRPTKIEGNPNHPASLGATRAFDQASVLTLYDPDRSQTPTHLGQVRTWSEAFAALRQAVLKQRLKRGAGLRILTSTVVSPTLAQQLEDLLKTLPQAKWHAYEPLHEDMAFRGAQMAFGQPVNAVYDFGKADRVLSLDADFLGEGPASLRYAADFMARRRVRTTETSAHEAHMSRLYVVETAVSCTGAKADHRLALRAGEIEGLARAIGAGLGLPAGGNPAGPHEKWIAAVSKDLGAHRGRSLVLAGSRQPPEVHLLAHAMNHHLGNVGQTVRYTEPVEAQPVEAQPGDQTQSLQELVEDMRQGRVEVLVILEGNPVYTAPVDLQFAEHLQRVPLRVHLGLYQDETAVNCHWHLPETHFLEAWSDARAFDGTASIVQPLIEPLYQGRSVHEVVALLTTLEQTPGYDLVRGHWRKHWDGQKKSGNFDDFWQSAVHDGVVPDTAFPSKSVSLQGGWQKHLQAKGGDAAAPQSEGLEIVFAPDPTIYDGRFANNGWLQECSKPITQITWDNAAIMSPATAAQFGLELGSYAHGGERGGYYQAVVELQLGGRTVRGPFWIMPGHADGSVTVYLGYGRERAGRVGGDGQQPVGFNAYALRTSDRPWFAPGLQVTKTEDGSYLACVQGHHTMAGRDLVRSGTLEQYHKTPQSAAEPAPESRGENGAGTQQQLSLYEPFDYGPPKRKWGMLIDLTTCVGCNACVVACQAENNIPVVGKDQVLMGREMHWLRVDRYVGGPPENPEEFHFQPVPCMQCEKAPCEYVCPTAATVHSHDGLNDMIYNRCVGTRFCSNNCPYKVRRFNFFQYSDFQTPSRRLQYNPDVTVRSRGVMEKCTYCVQRIRHAEIDAETENRPIADGEVLTACQAACPTQAIVFGDLNDPKSTVQQWKQSPLHYGLLAELNTRPRTTYLASLRNPNPELEAT